MKQGQDNFDSKITRIPSRSERPDTSHEYKEGQLLSFSSEKKPFENLRARADSAKWQDRPEKDIPNGVQEVFGLHMARNLLDDVPSSKKYAHATLTGGYDAYVLRLDVHKGPIKLYYVYEKDGQVVNERGEPYGPDSVEQHLRQLDKTG